jgi:hypothetical protein
MYDPRDYDGITLESEMRERDEALADQREREEEEERLAAIAQDEEDRLYWLAQDAAAAQQVAEPVLAALSGWRNAIAIAQRRAA